LSIQRAKLIHANALGGGRDYQFVRVLKALDKLEGANED
jgi:hypothetical protein